MSNLTITPAQAAPNTKVEISVTVTNIGDTAGSYTVALKINNESMGSKSIKLQPGESGQVGFMQTRDMPSTYQVDVNGLTGSFTVSWPGQAPTTTTTTTTTAMAWTIPTGSGTNLRAVHMGGNWGTNRNAVLNLPDEYFEYLRDLNVNWVGISVAVHVDGSMDSTVELDYSESLSVPTFRDETIRSIIRKFRNHGFNVYIHIAFEDTNKGEHPFSRWQLGDPLAHTEDANIQADYWPWRTDHPQHQAFITEFWQTYTDCLVHIAQLAEEEGVGSLTLGTETDRLFRSRNGGSRWPNNFLPQMQNMVSSVRAVYSGLLSYEMHHTAVTDPNFYEGSKYIFKDLGLDFIAVSAYFQLWPSVPNTVPSVAELEAKWTAIFNGQLKSLRERNNNKQIIFTEFGYVDSLAALENAAADEFTNKTFIDNNGNGKDDGEEAQANAYQALFNFMNANPGVVEGAFLWDVMMSSEQEYQNSFYTMRTFNIRLKLAEAIVRVVYLGWR